MGGVRGRVVEVVWSQRPQTAAHAMQARAHGARRNVERFGDLYGFEAGPCRQQQYFAVCLWQCADRLGQGRDLASRVDSLRGGVGEIVGTHQRIRLRGGVEDLLVTDLTCPTAAHATDLVGRYAEQPADEAAPFRIEGGATIPGLTERRGKNVFGSLLTDLPIQIGEKAGAVIEKGVGKDSFGVRPGQVGRRVMGTNFLQCGGHTRTWSFAPHAFTTAATPRN